MQRRARNLRHGGFVQTGKVSGLRSRDSHHSSRSESPRLSARHENGTGFDAGTGSSAGPRGRARASATRAGKPDTAYPDAQWPQYAFNGKTAGHVFAAAERWRPVYAQVVRPADFQTEEPAAPAQRQPAPQQTGSSDATPQPQDQKTARQQWSDFWKPSSATPADTSNNRIVDFPWWWRQ